MKKHRLNAILSLSLITVLFLATILKPQFTSSAAPLLELIPLTWNVVGLDSNNVDVGPNNFPVGVRVCNTGDEATNLTATFEWDDGENKFSGHDYINLRSGSLEEISLLSLDAGSESEPACTDFYFEVSLKRDSNAYGETRRYHIDVTADGGISLTTPQPREIFVEYLISQNRNSTDNVILDGVSIPAGGSMSLVVGNSYNITLESSTATQGYEQLESYLNFPNTIFQIDSVATTHSAVPDPETDLLRKTKLYADGCGWENDPDSPNYLSCLSTGKYGGDLEVSYDVTIIGGAGTTQTLNSLIYDFSGSSFHYNSDYSTSARIIEIVGPSDITIQKQFVPDTISPGGTSTMMITLTNPTGTTIEGVNFEDTFPQSPAYPDDMVVAATPNVSMTGCGLGTLVAPISSGSVSPGTGSIAFANGSIAPESSCIIKIDVTVPSEGAYTNTTEELFIDTDVGTGNTASADLTVAEAVACIPDTLMVEWIMDPSQGTTVPPAYWTIADNVSTAIASVGVPTSGEIVTTGNPANSWETWGYKGSPTFTTADEDYVQFAVDTSNYSDVIMLFEALRDSPGPTDLYVYYDDGEGLKALTGAHYELPIDTWNTYTNDFTDLTNTNGVTIFRIYGHKANNNQSGANLFLDNIRFTGCSYPDPPPSISKEFLTDPIPVGGTSLLRFTLYNTDPSAVDLTGVTFTDTLPDGLEVDNPAGASTTCEGSPTWSPSAGESTLTFGDPSGASMAIDSTCTAQVSITATRAGTFDNVSGYISSTQSGENTGPDGYATDSLTAIAPPQLSKNFAATTILTDTSTTLSFTLTNPNQSASLSGIGFIDDLPAGLTVADSTSSVCGGTLTTTSTTPPNQIALSGGSLAADSSCSFAVTVTGDTIGTKDNVTSVVTSTEGGNGEAASATLYVQDPNPAFNLLKQIGLTNDPAGTWTTFLSLDTDTDVYYKFTVENTGDVDLEDVSLTDPILAGEGISVESCFEDPLTTDEPIQVCIVGPLEVTVPGKLENTATAHATYDETDVTPEPSSSAWYGSPALTLEKSVSESYFLEEGDPLNYSYVVTNSGYTSLLGPVTVEDDKVTVICQDVNEVGDHDAYLDPADHPTGSGSLAESVTCEAEYFVTEGDVDAGSVTNLATATVGGVSSPEASTTINQGFGELALILTKTGDLNNDAVEPNEISNVGDTITYTFTVTNNSEETLTGVQVLDPMLPLLSCSIALLVPDATAECSAVYSLTQADIDAGIVNNTATADSNETEPINVSESIPLTQAPGLSIDKTAVLNNDAVEPNGVSNVGDTIQYTLTVENTGYVTLTNVQVTDPLLPSLSCSIASLAPDATEACSAVYSLTQSDIDAGSVYNTATADSEETDPISDSVTVLLTQVPQLSISKEVSDDGSNWVEKVWVGINETVYFRVRLTNGGNVTLTDLSVEDSMADCSLVQDSDVTGDDDGDFEPGETWLYTCSLAASAGTQINTATADTEQTEAVSDDASYVGGNIFDPPFGIKTFDDADLPIIQWTIVWINNSNETALDVTMSDPIPAGTTLQGIPDCFTDPSNSTPTTVTTSCFYEPSSSGYPNGRIVWAGSLGPDLGAGDADEADDEIYIRFLLRVDEGVTSVENIATIDSDLNGDEDMDDPGEENAASVQALWQAPSGLPETGFAPGVQTALPVQPEHLRYANLYSLWLEVPELRAYMPIVGIPKTAGGWNVTWLGDNAGYLNGTAFPTWEGNTGITGHVTLPSGVPGPFANLKDLQWGDEIILHAWGKRYVYQVRKVQTVRPNDVSVLKHEDRDWVTLITCQSYDERLDRYRWRLAVRAVLISVEPERH